VLCIKGVELVTSLRIFLFGLLFGPILAETLGFLSVFVSLKSDAVANIMMSAAFYAGGGAPIIFAIALQFAAHSCAKTIIKIWSAVIGLLYTITASHMFFEEGDTLESFLYNSNYILELTCLLTGGFIVYRYVLSQHEIKLVID